MDISIKLICSSCMEELFEFELQNRAFFERTCPSRGDSYYDINNFKNILEELITEQKNDLLYMYLIYNEFDEIIGRVNLVDVQRGIFNKAELGYRIGEIHQGKGYTTRAVKLILEEASSVHKLHKIEAGTSSKNTVSQSVLIKNGFELIAKQENYILLNGEWNDNIIFEKILI
ncbi:MAG: GNAT family N-acetyltransferase [Peptostreptococcaceae bacterium]